jgi:hypothetical protein
LFPAFWGSFFQDFSNPRGSLVQESKIQGLFMQGSYSRPTEGWPKGSMMTSLICTSVLPAHHLLVKEFYSYLNLAKLTTPSPGSCSYCTVLYIHIYFTCG